MNLLYVAAFVSFLAGAFGYIIVRFWILPIGRYRKIRQRVARDLKQLDAGFSEALAKSFREDATLLSDALDLDVPHWYRMVLANRDESPADAAMHLMKLANTKDPSHQESRAAEIRKALRLQRL